MGSVSAPGAKEDQVYEAKSDKSSLVYLAGNTRRDIHTNAYEHLGV
jgi:hypothetical protein